MVLHGHFHPDYAAVARRVIGLLRRQPGGASVCVYDHGEKVVDIWGGTRDKTGRPWTADTLAFSASTTKGMTSVLLHHLIDRGLARYDDRVADHWPAFAAHGKERITIRHVLAHQAGLYNIADHDLDIDEFHDWPASLRAIERARPAHEPGRYSAYHALTYGPLAGGLVEKISGQPFQTVLNEALVSPLGLDGLFIGLPEHEHHRLAKLIAMDGRIGAAYRFYSGLPDIAKSGIALANRLTHGAFSHTPRALLPTFVEALDFNSTRGMQAILPAVNGAFTARSVARVYALLAEGGTLDGQRLLRADTIARMNEHQSSGLDRVVNFPMGWRLGFHQVYSTGPRSPDAFGHFGFGGSGGWCDPSRRLSLALTLNTCVGTGMGELRFAILSGDVLRCADRRHRAAFASRVTA